MLFPINSAILFYSYIRVWHKSERKFTLLCWNENVRKGSFRLAKREIYEQKTEEILLPIVAEYDFELVDVEYVKEGSTWYLRAYIDKPGGITVNDCEMVSRRLSNILDEKDYIEDSYVMEISSPGLGRPLKKEKDFKRSLGREVELRT